MSGSERSTAVTVLKPPKGWELIDWRELVEYRDLFFFLVSRNIKVLYAQTVMGFAWAFVNPFMQIVVYTLIFGKVAKLDTDGIPYMLFSTLAIVPWSYMSDAMTQSSQSLVGGQAMLGKVYFPRLIFPITPVLSKLVDFSISLTLVAGALLYYHFFTDYQVSITSNLLFLPVFILMMIAVPAGIGMWLSALAIRFRDVKFIMSYVIRLLIYSAPIVYTASEIPETYRFVYSLNPIVGVIEGFRAAFLGTTIPWMYILPGMVTALLLVVSGAFYFRRMERVFVDVI